VESIVADANPSTSREEAASMAAPQVPVDSSGDVTGERSIARQITFGVSDRSAHSIFEWSTFSKS
jgi:hypothetical protein